MRVCCGSAGEEALARARGRDADDPETALWRVGRSGCARSTAGGRSRPCSASTLQSQHDDPSRRAQGHPRYLYTPMTAEAQPTRGPTLGTLTFVSAIPCGSVRLGDAYVSLAREASPAPDHTRAPAWRVHSPGAPQGQGLLRRLGLLKLNDPERETNLCKDSRRTVMRFATAVTLLLLAEPLSVTAQSAKTSRVGLLGLGSRIVAALRSAPPRPPRAGLGGGPEHRLRGRHHGWPVQPPGQGRGA